MPTSEHSPEWYGIKSMSIAQFVNICAAALGDRYNRELRGQLYQMAHTSGRTNVYWERITYTAPMMLDLYRASRRSKYLEPAVPPVEATSGTT